MKLVPGSLPPIPTSTAMDRLPLPMHFNPDALLWRYPGLGFLGQTQNPPPSPSSLYEYKSQLPSSLTSDPRIWSREDVSSFLRWTEREFDLQPIDMDMFQMNGKAICLLTRQDLAERAPGSGDILYNVLQILVRDAIALQRMLPSSPVTPTTRQPYPLSPHSHPPTPNWNLLAQQASDPFHSSHAASLAAHLMAQNNSVTLSPAPSVDSQSGSPQHADNAQTYGGSGSGGHSVLSTTGSNGSNHSDSEEDGYESNKTGQNGSPPHTPHNMVWHDTYPFPLPLIQNGSGSPRSPKMELNSPGLFKREFFPSDSPEPNTNGRLLWDFLQQLLNDPQQRYTNYIAWKNRETGVFKIVDPAGLAKLWGIQKNHLSMNYDKMSRALRYYYRVNILRKVQGERHCYQFLRNPNELKNIKNISLLRQSSPTSTKPPPSQIVPSVTIKPEPSEMDIGDTKIEEFDDKPTDLSITVEGPTDLSSTSRHVNIICSPDPPIIPSTNH